MQKLIAIILILFVGSLTNAQDKKFLSELDKYVAEVMKEFKVPGIGLAIVKDGKVVLTKGYGVRTLGDPAPVDARTRFGIASNTKAFTATALALLVEEGKLEWDAPVIKYIPWFALADPYVTHELSVRDLLVHRSGLGLGGGDLLIWPGSTYTRKEITQRLRYVPLVKSFRSTYAYDNVLYLVAGEVIEAVSGKTWEDFIKTRILDKVGMTGSTVTCSSVIAGGNVATPHAELNGKVQPIKPYLSDNTNPAGGINSCAEDIAKWMKVQLDSGRLEDGSHLFLPSTTRQLWSIVTPVPIADLPPELKRYQPNFSGYALGFEVRDYLGKKYVWHTGGLFGYVSKISLIPEINLGVAVFTNQEVGAAFGTITNYILDGYLGAPPFDWLKAFKKVIERNAESIKATMQSTLTTRDSLSKPALPLQKYAGMYTDMWYGNILITYKDGKLILKFMQTPGMEGEMEHWQYDTFIVRWFDREMRADAYITFSLRPDGSIELAKMKAVSPDTDFSYDFHDLLLKPEPVKK
jgi:CubicO group peptidase (beta-lactamase class C family)